MNSGASATSDSPEVPLVASVVPLVPAWRVDRDFDYLVREDLAVVPGSLVRIRFGNRRVRGIVRSVERRRPERDLDEVGALVLPESLLEPPQDKVFDFLAERYLVPQGRAFDRAVPPRVRVSKPVVTPNSEGTPEARLLPSFEGGRALIQALRRGAGGTWCVQALSGPAHAELIVEMAAQARGQVLVAVPEVRYGSHVLDALSSRWNYVARVDASRSDAERARAWLALAARHQIGAGGRSTLLAPAPELGLLIVDDDHDPSFKEDRSPRYDARRVAEARAATQGAVCVFVSPTPSLEYAGRALAGEINWVAPTRSDERSRRPITEVVTPSGDRMVTHELHARVRDALRAEKRVGLLVPRRGFSRAVWCAQCRRSLRCSRCEAGLTYDRERRRVRCSRCGLTGPPPDVCPSCGATDFRYLGAGSERLADQIASAFPRARVVRVDPDVLERAEPESLRVQDADIYLTTWIGTKEMVRPPVDLVGVLGIDHLIRRPDWRAAERAYQALAEMSEWAGPEGRLVIQSDDSRHHSIQAVVRGDYRFFAERELVHRRELAYPPFSELVKIRARGPQAKATIDLCVARCREAGATVLGPIQVPEPGGGDEDAPLEVLAKCTDATLVARALREIAASTSGATRLQFDVDPR
ncbi:MAG TPA: primosomal protein N' [Actinomycetota bacterium]|nr:primosomal protein N' [Actinomycetota bacterium]